MPSSSSLAELSLAAFAERVAGAGAVPASGCVAALQGALGAALVSMAFRHAAGEGRSTIPAYMQGRADELGELSRRLLALVDEDAAAYRAFTGAEDDEARRTAARAVLETPLEIAESALSGLRLAAVGAAEVEPLLASESRVGAEALAAAVRGGLGLVRANAPRLDDEDWVQDRLALLPGLADEAGRLLADAVRGKEHGA